MSPSWPEFRQSDLEFGILKKPMQFDSSGRRQKEAPLGTAQRAGGGAPSGEEAKSGEPRPAGASERRGGSPATSNTAGVGPDGSSAIQHARDDAGGGAPAGGAGKGTGPRGQGSSGEDGCLADDALKSRTLRVLAVRLPRR